MNLLKLRNKFVKLLKISFLVSFEKIIINSIDNNNIMKALLSPDKRIVKK